MNSKCKLPLSDHAAIQAARVVITLLLFVHCHHRPKQYNQSGVWLARTHRILKSSPKRPVLQRSIDLTKSLCSHPVMLVDGKVLRHPFKFCGISSEHLRSCGISFFNSLPLMWDSKQVLQPVVEIYSQTLQEMAVCVIRNKRNASTNNFLCLVSFSVQIDRRLMLLRTTCIFWPRYSRSRAPGRRQG